MKENYESVQKGFSILLETMSGFIGQKLHQSYKENWWEQVRIALSDQKDVPLDGDYADLVDWLDIANCIRLIDRRWNEVFFYALNKNLNCRTYAKELMGVRNIVAHIGAQDLDQRTAERALDTMSLLCKEMDEDAEKEIRECYWDIRSKSVRNRVIYRGVQQPKSDSVVGPLVEGSLLSQVGTDLVQKTEMTRKVSYNGKTVVYPVYRIALDLLYYNDQNDRIATWITKYEAENGKESLKGLDSDIYNRIIENFIYDSNPESIEKTQKNIDTVGQREPGVILADGRVVDGNRRFTCLRRLERLGEEPKFFETVIMDMDIQQDKKQIKLLELAIQHGEEKKVDYDMIDYAIGTYRDVVQTKLLTVEEYASSTNEPVADVKKRIAVAEVCTEFLDYLHLHNQYHAAREYQVYSLFYEMMPSLNKLTDQEKTQLKQTAFINTMMKAIKDQRKFIRDIKNLLKTNIYKEYFKEQEAIAAKIKALLADMDVRGKDDLDEFASEHEEITLEMQNSMENALQKLRKEQLKSKPTENVKKSLDLMMDVDPRLFASMEDEDKEILKSQLDAMTKLVAKFKRALSR